MIEAGVGCSKKENAREAAREAGSLAVSSAGIIRSDFALVFATPHHSGHFDEIIREVKTVTGASRITGCSGIGVLTHQEEIEISPGIAVMAVHSNMISGYTFLYRNLFERDSMIGHAIGEFAKQMRKKSELLILFPDPNSVHVPALLNSIQEECGSPLTLIGGCASGEESRKQTYQIGDHDTASGSGSGIYLTGEFSHAIGIAQACHPVSGPLLVTRAMGGRIQELRGRPALEHLLQLIQEPVAENLPSALRNLLIGLPVDPSSTELQSGNYIVRKITGIDPSDGSILTSETVTEGQPLSFVVRDETRAAQEFEEMLENLSQAHLACPPRFGLYFQYAGRRDSLCRTMPLKIHLIRKYFGTMPLIGFFSDGEIAPVGKINCLHTLSGVLALISDPME